MIRTILKPLSFIPALLLMYMIFSFSGQTGDVSSQLSYKVSYKIVETADYVFDGNLETWQIDEWANKINFITRKLAHMTEYFALAVAVSFPLYVYGLHGILLMLVAGLICVGFACGDEYHQSFVAGRSPSVKDVCIDSVGVFLGIIAVRIVGWTGRKTIFKPKKPKVKKVKGRKKVKYMDDTTYHVPYGNPQGQNRYGAPPNPGQSYYDPRSAQPQGPTPYQTGQSQPQGYHGPQATPPPYSPGYGYQGADAGAWAPQDQSIHSEIPEPEYMEDWRIDPSDVFNNESAAGRNRAYYPENDALADDWGLKDPASQREPHQRKQVPPVQPPLQNAGPANIPNHQQPRREAPKKKPTRKKKDWFFDL
ncbi:MAG: VanZ family protein [Lachnospiraceae bacterium]|jgi:VanZ family protein|nr:VanZ family protein [Lachnospiraceae bacterium]